MNINRLSHFCLALFIFVVTQSCDEPTPNFNCRPSIYVDGEFEEFCIEPSDKITSELTVPNGQFLAFQYADSTEFARSPHFEGYLLAYTGNRPNGSSLDHEIAFLQELQVIFKPSSRHKFNLDSIGGFAMELWNNEGHYFNTEYSKMKNDAMFEVINNNIYLLRPDSVHRYTSQFGMYVEPIGPILLSDESGTNEHSIEFEHPLSFRFDFSMFR